MPLQPPAPDCARPVVRLKDSQYQPAKRELEEDIGIDMTPEALAEATLGTVTLKFPDKEPA